jgi:hypothetical protein
MNSIRNPFTWSAVIIIALIAMLTTGSSCRSPQGQVGAQVNPDGSIGAVSGGVSWDPSTNVNVQAAVQLDPTSGQWFGNLQVTFKDPPPALVATLAAKAGATGTKSGTVYRLRYDSSNMDHRTFSQICRENGAVFEGVN